MKNIKFGSTFQITSNIVLLFTQNRATVPLMKLILLSNKLDDLKQTLGIDIIINQSPKAKRMSLRIDAKKRLPVLSLPKYYSKKQVVEFVTKHQYWIDDRLNEIPSLQEFKFGQKIMLLGQEYIITSNPLCRSNCKLEGIYLYAPIDESFLHSRVIKFIKAYAKAQLFTLSQQKATLIGAKIKSVVIKDTKSRWGSCSIKTNINYNYRVILAPFFVSEAIVCHEVCHLIEHNHAKEFYDLLYSICPEYDKSEKWLKTHSKELYAFG